MTRSDVIFGVGVTPELYNAICKTIIVNYNQKMASLPKKVRGCGHAEPTSKYCGECGKPAWKSNPDVVPLTQEKLEEMSLPEFYDEYPFDWVYDGWQKPTWSLGYRLNKLNQKRSLDQIKIDLVEAIYQHFGYRIESKDIKFIIENTDR